MRKLFIVDGHALIFKMYYAFMRRPMINSKGTDTSILYGFTKYILELIRREQPTHFVVTFDPPAKTFRHEAYSEYKATRSAAPELVKEALDPLTEILEAMGIPVVMVPGYEADDVIGTIARQFAQQGFEVFMVTPDKDLGQLISTNIYQYKPGKGGDDNEIWGIPEVCGHYGIERPEQIIDILTLWGDSSDNVPGVRGVGEKGAGKLVKEFGSVDGIYEHLDRLSQKQREAFEEAKGHIGMSRFLVTIKTDVPIQLSENDAVNNISINKAVIELFDRYEFPSLKKMLPEGSADMPLPQVEQNSRCVPVRHSSFAAIASEAKMESLCAVRIEGGKVLLAVGENCTECSASEAATILMDASVAKVSFGVKEQIKALERLGIKLLGDLYDLELMHYVLNPERSHKIDLLCRSYLDMSLEMPEETQMDATVPDLFSAAAQNVDKDTEKAARECVASALLYPALLSELKEQKVLDLYRKIEMPLIRVLARMEMDGVKIDPAALDEYGKSLEKELAKLESEVRELAGEPELNISSPRQIGIVLFDKLKLDSKAKKGKTGNYSTDEETLQALKDKSPIIGKILEFRAVKKLLSTYIEPLPALVDPVDGRIHTTYTQALTATGRLSSIKPNLQNIPIRSEMGREIRKSFVPSSPDGAIVSADYSQIELRIMAHLSGDQAMISDFLAGDDIHSATAAKIYKEKLEDVTKEQRRTAKTANFGIIYGISAFGLSQRLGISNRESKELIEQYFQNYTGVASYIDNVVENARREGFVSTIFGRKRFLPDINSRNQVVRKLAERNAVNAPIQGSAADIIKLAMIAIARRLESEGWRSKMVLQVHDELIFDAVAEEADSLMEMVSQEMENVCKLAVPLLVDCNKGRNWLDAH